MPLGDVVAEVADFRKLFLYYLHISSAEKSYSIFMVKLSNVVASFEFTRTIYLAVNFSASIFGHCSNCFL